jgi:hypothetical protein
VQPEKGLAAGRCVFAEKTRPGRVLAHSRHPLAAAAAVNTARWRLVNRFAETGLPIELSNGGRTKWNRTRLGLPKTHSLDAVCIGSLEAVLGWNVPVQQIGRAGRGAYQRTRLTAQGFPRGYLMRAKRVGGFQTVDIIRAIVPGGKTAGVIVGRVAIRATGNFSVQTTEGVVQGIGWRYCRVLHRADGYSYATQGKKGSASFPCLKAGVLALSAG